MESDVSMEISHHSAAEKPCNLQELPTDSKRATAALVSVTELRPITVFLWISSCKGHGTRIKIYTLGTSKIGIQPVGTHIAVKTQISIGMLRWCSTGCRIQESRDVDSTNRWIQGFLWNVPYTWFGGLKHWT